MIPLVTFRELSHDQISDLCRSSIAIVGLSEAAAWSIQNSDPRDTQRIADDIQHALKVARSLLETLQDRLDQDEKDAS